MLSEPTKHITGPAFLLVLSLFQTNSVMAGSDEIIQREVEAQITASEKLQGNRIDIHVQQRLVVLTGEVRIYEQKLISERISSGILSPEWRGITTVYRSRV